MAAWAPIVTLHSFYGVWEGSPGARLGAFGASWGLPAGCRAYRVAPGARRGISDVFWGLPDPSGTFHGLVAFCGFLALLWGCRALLAPSVAFLKLLGSLWDLPGLFKSRKLQFYRGPRPTYCNLG